MRRYFVFILASIILASCGSAPEEIPDWCWTYDLRASGNDFSITSGQWVDGTGLQTIDGDLAFSYTYDEFVTPSVVYVTVQRETVVGDLFITTAGIIYGVSSAFSVNIPSGNTDIGTASFLPATLGDAGNSINVTINADSAGDEELNVISIEVLGNDETPFDYNPCDEPTPTPSITPFPTGEATFTLTPTNTATPTNTPTPTITPTVPALQWDWYKTWDFNITDGVSDGWGNRLILNPDNTTWCASGNLTTYSASSGWWRVRNGLGLDFLDREITKVYVVGYSRPGAGNPSFFTNLLYNGGGNQYYDLTSGAPFSFQGGTGWKYWTYSVGRESAVLSNNLMLMACRASSYTDYKRVEIGGLGTCPFASCDVLPTPTPTNTGVPTNTSVPTTTATPFGLPTNTPYNYQPTIDLTQITATPSTTPQPTSTDFPQSTAYATQTIGAGTPTPSIEEIRENEAEWELLEEEKRGNNAIENLLQDILDALSGDGGTGDGGTGPGIDGVSDWSNAISDSLSGIQDLFGKVGGLFSQSVSSANALVTSFYTAPPQAIPGLPLCMTAPLEHDICAIYYVMDWTLFAPNTLGSFIVPLLLAIMNVLVIFRVLRYVLTLINRTEDVTR